MTRTLFFFAFVTTFFISCKKETIEQESIIRTYLHISQTRTNSNPDLNPELKTIDFSSYDMRWLGGDLAYLTSYDDATMQEVDSTFDLLNPNTLWSLGNNDYSDLERIEAFTDRPPYYTYHKEGITYLVLDTQDNSDKITGKQLELFHQVTDTIKNSSHLVILHHKLIWVRNNSFLEPQIDAISNGPIGDCSFCIRENNFYGEIYKKLLCLKEDNIEVICVAGDIGSNSKQFEHTTSEGIIFLASGIYFGSENNKALLFKHDIVKKKLTWDFKLLKDL